MAERVLLRVLCSKTKATHVVGSLLSDPSDGYRLRYQSAVRIAATGDDRRDFEAREVTLLLDDAGPAYCQACGLRYVMPVDSIRRSAAAGRRSFRLQGRRAEARYVRKQSNGR